MIYHVSTTGSDAAAGSASAPFRTIQRCANAISTGDKCCIASGTYHEAVTVNGKTGTTFEACGGGRVALDGTVAISSAWQIHTGSIWKTTLTSNVWQLFVEYREELVMARWPNARFSDDSVLDKANHWAHGTIDQSSTAYTNGDLIDEPHGSTDLAASSIDATGAVAILNVGSFKTWSRVVTSHTVGSNTFSYAPVPNGGWRTKHHDYFLEGKLELLDAEGEWWLDTSSSTLYLWPPNNADPNNLEIRGKVHSYAIDVSGSDYVTLKGLDFFGATFRFSRCVGCVAEDLNLVYPSTSKRMLRLVDTPPDVTTFADRSENGTVRRCVFRFTDGPALEMYSGGMLLEESYMHSIDWTSSDLNGLMTTIQLGGSGNIIRRNTMHRLGASATMNPGDAALIEYNDISDTGYTQSDGALSQMMVGQQPGAEIRYNWLHDTIKYGARFDGNGLGNNGLMHHNVLWNTGKALMVKGFNHSVYHNTAFDSSNGNDILIMIAQGGNEGTQTINNAANRIAGHRSGTYSAYPVPGTYSNNWNGYVTGGDVKDELIDPLGTLTGTRDFRPKAGSALIDAGSVVPGVTGSYLGSAPDIGAYEAGAAHWVPGVTWDVSAKNGTFVPPGAEAEASSGGSASGGTSSGLVLGLGIGGGAVGGLVLLAAGFVGVKWMRGRKSAYVGPA